jgi:hypothetical protein
MWMKDVWINDAFINNARISDVWISDIRINNVWINDVLIINVWITEDNCIVDLYLVKYVDTMFPVRLHHGKDVPVPGAHSNFSKT